jgi:hypothetical protein
MLTYADVELVGSCQVLLVYEALSYRMLTYADVELVGSCQVLLVYEALSYHFPISGWWFCRDVLMSEA